MTSLLPRSVVICLLICSCATDPNYKLDESEIAFTRIAIVTPDDIVSTAIKGSETKFEKTEKGAAYGATGGALGGAMVGAIACGPYLYGICVIGISTAGMVAGGAGGALYGFTGISEEDSLFIMEEMAYLRQERNFQSELATGVRNKLPKDLVSTPGIADAQAITTVDSIEFVKRNKEAVYMEVFASVTIMAKEASGGSKEVKSKLHVKSQKADIEDWLRVGSGKFEASVDECLDGLISEMVAVILMHYNANFGDL